MSKILIDNWSIEETYALEESEYDKYPPYMDLLETIIFWDELYYPDNERAGQWRWIFSKHEIVNLLHPLNDDDIKYRDMALQVVEENFHYLPNNLEIGAIRYLLLGMNSGLDYLPCYERSVFLSELEYNMGNDSFRKILSEISEETLSKSSTISQRREEIQALNNRLMSLYMSHKERYGEDKFEFPRPIIDEYILRNKPENMDFVQYAFQLRDSYWVRQYRNYLREYVENVNQRNYERVFEIVGLVGTLLNGINIGMSIFDVEIMPIILATTQIAQPLYRVYMDARRCFQLTFVRELEEFTREL